MIYCTEIMLQNVYCILYTYNVVGCDCTVIFKWWVIVPTCNCEVLFHSLAPSESSGVPIKFRQSIPLFLSVRMKQRETCLEVCSKHFSLWWKSASYTRGESRKGCKFPCSVLYFYLILTIILKCRHILVKHSNIRFYKNLLAFLEYSDACRRTNVFSGWSKGLRKSLQIGFTSYI
jgi:hypothetical protein